jgi:Tol biopolymer transport system component
VIDNMQKSLILLSMLLTSVLVVPYVHAQATSETLLSAENAYNPIPSPNGQYIAYVRTGWDGSKGTGGFGRSNLVSEVAIIDGNGTLVSKASLVDSFLSGWTPDSTDLVCYRDGQYLLVSVNGEQSSKGRLPGPTNVIGTERVSYLPSAGKMVWSQQDGLHTILATPSGVLTKRDGWWGGLIAPSPDGKYVAITGGWQQSRLWVYDTDRKTWADLGEADIHPDREWDYIKPSWNPWFADSSRLAYFTHDNSVLSISTADGRQRTDIHIEGPAGIAAPSPDGRLIAYVTFEPSPRKQRPDLQFWGGTQVWVVPVVGKQETRPVTLKSLDETYDLRWLNNHTLVFDRVADVNFYRQSRIWKADVPR